MDCDEKQSELLVAVDAPRDAIGLIATAMSDPRIDAEKLGRLLVIKKEWEADEARKDFSAAIAQFQRECPIIARGDVANGRPYARLDRIWRTIRPVVDRCGLAVTWETATYGDGALTITGHLRHEHGHAVPISYTVAIPEQIKAQNAAQRIASATTYAKRYALCNVLGINTGEDDDGNGAGSSEPGITLDQVSQILDYTDNGVGDLRRILDWCGVDRPDEIPQSRFRTIMQRLADIAAQGGAA